MPASRGPTDGETVGVDGTTPGADAAMRPAVRRDTGEGHPEFLTKPAKESGTQTPTREDLAGLDRGRKSKAGNDDWQHPRALSGDKDFVCVALPLFREKLDPPPFYARRPPANHGYVGVNEDHPPFRCRCSRG